MSMKIIVTGAEGQLGTDVMLALRERGIEGIGVDRSDFDITDAAATEAFITAEKPDGVIHCAAFTAVDKAESERELCFAVNVTGSENVACACEKCGAKCLYISTDYVFGGDEPDEYEPDDKKSPVNYYGETKLAGENAVQALCSKHFIVRTSWVFGLYGRNFVKSMLYLGARKGEIGVVCDQIGSPTFTPDLARLCCDIIQTEKYGVYHATNEGYCSWAEFADEIMHRSGTPCEVKAITSEEYPCAARRPKNSRLSKASLDKVGFERLPHWKDALSRYLDGVKESE